ncbi:MAG TPA: translation elongation factor-like protein [Candidatus Paceibacterota bacterium]|nr:translation elongation factor-like protein [Candidatus Paceibacterota bacterium]
MPKTKSKKKTKAVKKAAKKAGKKTRAPKKAKTPKPIGAVTHFYGDIEVAIVKFKKAVKTGAKLHYKGATTDFEEVAKSMQYNHKPVAVAPKGKEVGIKVKDKVREGDEVFDAE